MAEVVSPITRQVTNDNREIGNPSVDIRLEEVEDCLLYDRHGVSIPFKKLYQDRKSVIIFVRVWENNSWVSFFCRLIEASYLNMRV